MKSMSFGRAWIAGVALCGVLAAAEKTILAEPDEPEADPGLLCISVEERLALEQVAADALISDCETGTPYCVEYTGTVGTGPVVNRGESFVVRYSAWVVPDIARVIARELWEYDVAMAPVRDRRLYVAAGETGAIGLRTALFPRGGELPSLHYA